MPTAQLAVFMSTKTISLSEEAYDRLQRRKREGESFNDVVNRLAGERPLLDIVGTGRPDDGIEAAIEDARENLEDSTGRFTAEMDHK
jgi:predicted CopG family antitoxin